MKSKAFGKRIYQIAAPEEFNALALEIFHYQAENCAVYAEFLELIGCNFKTINLYTDIPCLPISFFKTHAIYSTPRQPLHTFLSSATTGSIQSKHYFSDLGFYLNNAEACFNLAYGDLADYVFLGLLPGYLEREGSSLISMLNYFMQKGETASGFYLNNHDELFHLLSQLKSQKKKVILWGVTFALLDFIENYTLHFPDLIVIETGGMKGRRQELTREDVHQRLCSAFGCTSIHSEYGMTELLSQAYSKALGIFDLPPWMQVTVRNPNDPYELIENKSGAINVIDLANFNSLSFIATDDLGKKLNHTQFEVLGRLDNSDIRGCNLLIT